MKKKIILFMFLISFSTFFGPAVGTFIIPKNKFFGFFLLILQIIFYNNFVIKKYLEKYQLTIEEMNTGIIYGSILGLFFAFFLFYLLGV